MRRITKHNSLMSIRLALFLIIAASLVTVKAQDGFVKPGPDLEMGGIPPIPKSLANDVSRYTRIYGLPLAATISPSPSRYNKDNTNRHWDGLLMLACLQVEI